MNPLLSLIYGPWLQGRPENVIRLAGVLLLGAALAVLRVRSARPQAPPSKT
ncbi:hypothetical protein H5407_16865 [Mitsuaria sp. WAJ17]|uniref:hypothetical protein n=1 Tax=Mitsuaria sp. WAJ17 TaxID=2761452 RepID=UPI0016006CA8|nr:hypothetical protein [Mitsuaria sp. WAJ17]MBB2486902.1 hypothetical protein [Mitsuaria sp. WAJ17]